MQAKDTVMPLEYSVFDGLHCAGISDEKILLPIRKQAEISFKAGYGEGLKQGYADNRDEKKAGIKEVVEWINEQRVAAKTLIEGTGWGIPISEEKLEAQLKEWGL